MARDNAAPGAPSPLTRPIALVQLPHVPHAQAYAYFGIAIWPG